MAKLQMLSFEDDDIIDRRIKEESNYCDVAHLYVATYGIHRILLRQLSRFHGNHESVHGSGKTSCRS
jgi:hypothetical protein